MNNTAVTDMATVEEWNRSLTTIGLIETLHVFNDFVIEDTHNRVWPSCSFAHCVLDDYNLSDGDIKGCLQDEQINEWLISKLNDIYYEDFDSIQEGDDEYRSFDYWELVDGAQLTIDFMNWLMTIPMEIRDRDWNRYHGLPDEPTEEDWQRYMGRGAGGPCVTLVVRYGKCTPLAG